MKYENLLVSVEGPSRYIGNEFNMVRKNPDEMGIRFAFAFPDLYEVGMSHLGMHIIYGLLNNEEDIYCERVFSVKEDLESFIREGKSGLYTLETKSTLDKFDFVGFTLQYELSYTNILVMLELAGIPLRAKDRKDTDPIIIAGGPVAYNPEPIADFFDLFVIGEAEESLLELMDIYRNDRNKESFLKKASELRGIYVPSMYNPIYNEKGDLDGYEKLYEGASYPVVKRIVQDLDTVYYPDKPLVPNADIVHDRAVMEIFRGCTKGCRFCQAGMIYRPVREKSTDTIVETVSKIVECGGYEELSLASLSTLDYSDIENLVERLISDNEKRMTSVSLPSLRLDSTSVKVLKEIQKIRKTGLTFAPEAGTQRLRDVINKGVTEEDLYSTMHSIFSEGWDRVKLYFMLGLPTETMDDVNGIVDIAYKIWRIYKEESDRKRLTLTVSTSCFVPKPFTPFQWIRQEGIEELTSKEYHIKDKLKRGVFKYIFHDAKTSYLEGVFARGDRRLSDVLEHAFKNGAKFDGWDEYFDFDNWMASFEAIGIDPEYYIRERSFDEFLPWDIIDSGVTKKYLKSEYDKAMTETTTKDCREGCTGCGVNTGNVRGICFEA